MKAKDFVKLGTALRYLIDVREGAPLGGKFVLQNIKTVLALIADLGFVSTIKSSSVGQLKNLDAELQSVSATVPTISNVHAKELEAVCRRIRDSLFTEGDGIEVVIGKQISGGPLLPPKTVTIKWLFTYVPVPLWISFVLLLGGAYIFGVKTSAFSIVREFLALDSPPKVQNEITPEPDNPFKEVTRFTDPPGKRIPSTQGGWFVQALSLEILGNNRIIHVSFGVTKQSCAGKGPHDGPYLDIQLLDSERNVLVELAHIAELMVPDSATIGKLDIDVSSKVSEAFVNKAVSLEATMRSDGNC